MNVCYLFMCAPQTGHSSNRNLLLLLQPLRLTNVVPCMSSAPAHVCFIYKFTPHGILQLRLRLAPRVLLRRCKILHVVPATRFDVLTCILYHLRHNLSDTDSIYPLRTTYIDRGTRANGMNSEENESHGGQPPRASTEPRQELGG